MYQEDLTLIEFATILVKLKIFPRWKLGYFVHSEWDATRIAASFENQLHTVEKFLLKIRLENLDFNKVKAAMLVNGTMHLFWRNNEDCATAGRIADNFYKIKNHIII
jgi:hypothetical protein